MRSKILALLGVAVITVGTIGGGAFASNNDNIFKENQQAIVKENKLNTKQIAFQNSDMRIKDISRDNNNSGNTTYNKGNVNNPSKDIYRDMVKVMRDNGFKDAARYMQSGNYAAMKDYMNNISQEDYDKMIEIMNNNDYGYMGEMMESIGREGMIEMHNSMGSMHGGGSGMMGGFAR